MKPVQVARSVTQVVDGSAYKGDVTINGVKFEYELTIKVPIQDWTADPDLPTPAAACDLYRIQVKKDGTLLDLEVPERFLFLMLLVEFVVDFYYDPQTRGLNTMGATEASALLASIGGSLSIGLSGPEVGFDLPAEYREMLLAPKFGCAQALTEPVSDLHRRDARCMKSRHPLMKSVPIAASDVGKIFVVSVDEQTGRIMPSAEFLRLPVDSFDCWEEISTFDVNQ